MRYCISGSSQRPARYALCLSVAPAKSEAIWFYGKNRRGTPLPISMAREAVGVESRMKNLGLIIDSQWTFGQRLVHVAVNDNIWKKFQIFCYTIMKTRQAKEKEIE